MNCTIYFRKDVWTKFSAEKKKSELINHLLENHYEDVVPGSFKEETHEDHTDVSYRVKGPDKSKKKPKATGSKISPARLENGLCKIHGTPLDGRGKCLVKGCKYGK